MVVTAEVAGVEQPVGGVRPLGSSPVSLGRTGLGCKVWSPLRCPGRCVGAGSRDEAVDQGRRAGGLEGQLAQDFVIDWKKQVSGIISQVLAAEDCVDERNLLWKVPCPTALNWGFLAPVPLPSDGRCYWHVVGEGLGGNWTYYRIIHVVDPKSRLGKEMSVRKTLCRLQRCFVPELT